MPDLSLITQRLEVMESTMGQMMEMVAALAQQGALDASVDADNETTGEDEYPTIDLDNLMGA